MAELYLKTQRTFHGFSLRVNSACFVQVNRLLLSKTYKKPSGELIFGQGETTFSWGETTVILNISSLSGVLRFSFYKPHQIFDKRASMLDFFFVIRQTLTFLQCHLQCMRIKCVLRLISL